MTRPPDDPPNETLYHIIPYEYASEIAYIISGWARIEYDVDLLIWELAGLSDNPDIGACLTAQYMNINVRIQALVSIAKVRGFSEFQIAKINPFRERASPLGERRNRVAHDPWLSAYDDRNQPMDKMYRLQKTAKSKLEHHYKAVSLEELRNLKKEIDDVSTKFSELS